MHDAFSRLPEKDIDKIEILIKALKQIDKDEGSPEMPKILNNLEKSLKQWLKSPNTYASESPQKEQMQWLKKVLKLSQQAFNIYQEINSISSNQKTELLALCYYLQGELSTEKEFEYIRKVLRSYLTTIEQFRSPPPAR